MNKIMNKSKKISALLVAALLILTPQIQGEQSDQNKDESIYGLLSSEGQVNNLYVMNGFELGTDGVIEDYGQYSLVTNVTTKEVISYQDGKVSVKAPAGRFYYQGNLESKEVPWAISLTYKLDGNAITGEELIGKSGVVEIGISVSPNLSFADFANAYTLQIGTTLDTSIFENIQTSGGLMANAGKDKSITFTHLPGTTKSYTITANVKEFELNPIQFTGVFMALDVSLDGVEDMTSGLVDLQKGVADIFSGATKLKEGSGKFASGLDLLAANCGPLATGSASFSKGLTQASAGLNQLIAGAAQLETLATGLMASPDPQVQMLAGGYLQQAKALKQIAAGFDQLATQYTGLNKGIDQLNAGIQALPTGYTELDQGIAGLADGIGKMNEGTSTMDSEIQTKLDEMMNQYTHQDYQVASFVNPEKNKVTGVQFVLRTEALTIPEPPVVNETSDEDLSFWQRLINLFK